MLKCRRKDIFREHTWKTGLLVGHSSCQASAGMYCTSFLKKYHQKIRKVGHPHIPNLTFSLFVISLKSAFLHTLDKWSKNIQWRIIGEMGFYTRFLYIHEEKGERATRKRKTAVNCRFAACAAWNNAAIAAHERWRMKHFNRCFGYLFC